jgi:hypothetical protein
MNHRSLREIAKFAAGLVAADFLALIWFAQQGAFPINWMGMNMTADMLLPAFLFDIALVIILVHYGWHIGKMPRIREHSYLIVAGVIFSVVALAHLWRIFSGVDLDIAEIQIPMWLSWLGVVVTSYLAYTSFFFALRIKK